MKAREFPSAASLLKWPQKPGLGQDKEIRLSLPHGCRDTRIQGICCCSPRHIYMELAGTWCCRWHPKPVHHNTSPDSGLQKIEFCFFFIHKSETHDAGPVWQMFCIQSSSGSMLFLASCCAIPVDLQPPLHPCSREKPGEMKGERPRVRASYFLSKALGNCLNILLLHIDQNSHLLHMAPEQQSGCETQSLLQVVTFLVAYSQNRKEWEDG